MATTEGTLVASYNRGMKLLHRAGGVRTTVMDDRMQRAPVFGFDSAREALAFGKWVTANFDAIKREAEATTRTGRLLDIQQFSASRFMFLRFNFTTGDAAGQNLAGKATCAGLRLDPGELPRGAAFLPRVQPGHGQEELADQHPGHPRQAGHRRGDDPRGPVQGGHARHARADVPRAADLQPRRPDVRREQQRQPFRERDHRAVRRDRPGHRERGRVVGGAGAHRTARYGDYYYSITIPALIVATYGGGTGLPTQRECLDLLGCYGTGQVRKFAEIVAATVLCGEVSLGSAVVSEEWVAAHERLGRNRP